MVYMLVLASCSSFLIPWEKKGERVGSIITFILTIMAMALKYIINNQPPGKRYQTWLDYYLLFSYVLLTHWHCSFAIGIAALQELWGSAGPDEIDSVCAKLFFCLWNVSHLVLWLMYFFCSERPYQSWDTVRANQGHSKADETAGQAGAAESTSVLAGRLHRLMPRKTSGHPSYQGLIQPLFFKAAVSST